VQPLYYMASSQSQPSQSTPLLYCFILCLNIICVILSLGGSLIFCFILCLNISSNGLWWLVMNIYLVFYMLLIFSLYMCMVWSACIVSLYFNVVATPLPI
jgi:hypothetical protein